MMHGKTHLKIVTLAATSEFFAEFSLTNGAQLLS